MTQPKSQIRLRPRTHLDELVFERLKQGSDSFSIRGAKAITAYYLAEIVFQLDPKLKDPGLRLAVLESMHELEARLNLIKSLFPDLAPALLTTQPGWLTPSGVNGQVQSEPRFEMRSEPERPEVSPVRQNDLGSEGDSISDTSVDLADTPWAQFNVVNEQET